jgi:hypothetical protein
MNYRLNECFCVGTSVTLDLMDRENDTLFLNGLSNFPMSQRIDWIESTRAIGRAIRYPEMTIVCRWKRLASWPSIGQPLLFDFAIGLVWYLASHRTGREYPKEDSELFKSNRLALFHPLTPYHASLPF